MPVCLMYRDLPAKHRRFYRVEIAVNLFSEISVLREWGVAGRQGRSVIRLFDNLRDASLAADRARQDALRRGYVRTG